MKGFNALFQDYNCNRSTYLIPTGIEPRFGDPAHEEISLKFSTPRTANSK